MQMGIPGSNIPAAYQLTLPGYAEGIARAAGMRARNLYDANLGFQTMLNTQTFDASTIPIHQDLATTIYGGSLSGLGEADTDVNWDQVQAINDIFESGAFLPPDNTDDTAPSKNEDSSWWTDILKTFAGPVALGVGGRIAGQNPWAKAPVIASPAMTTGMKVALIGAAVLGGVYLLTRKR
jgi:hypothetical protein